MRRFFAVDFHVNVNVMNEIEPHHDIREEDMWITILGLALLDSLSFVSIVVTIFLLLSTAYHTARIMVYLLAAAGFYFLPGYKQ